MFLLRCAGKKESAVKPLVLICGAPALDNQFFDSALVLNKTYTTAAASAGGIPLLPTEIGCVEEYARIADGLILTGSFSYAPDREKMSRVETVELPKRAAFDKAIYRAFRSVRKPILGICLGHQMINKYEGGTVIKMFKLQDGVEHMLTSHRVDTTEKSLLRRLFGKRFIINSRHNDRIGELAPTLRATAHSPDGVIEGVEHRELPIYAVQWHPERMRGDIPDPPDGQNMNPLFEWFVGTCAALGKPDGLPGRGNHD
jgi:putative glutamine amidotransferase